MTANAFDLSNVRPSQDVSSDLDFPLSMGVAAPNEEEKEIANAIHENFDQLGRTASEPRTTMKSSFVEADESRPQENNLDRSQIIRNMRMRAQLHRRRPMTLV